MQVRFQPSSAWGLDFPCGDFEPSWVCSR